MGGWVDGWTDGWVDGKAGLRIAYSNQKSKIEDDKLLKKSSHQILTLIIDLACMKWNLNQLKLK